MGPRTTMSTIAGPGIVCDSASRNVSKHLYNLLDISWTCLTKQDTFWQSSPRKYSSSAQWTFGAENGEQHISMSSRSFLALWSWANALWQCHTRKSTPQSLQADQRSGATARENRWQFVDCARQSVRAGTCEVSSHRQIKKYRAGQVTKDFGHVYI